MRNTLLLLSMCCTLAAAQTTANVGVNTRTPETTLDVVPSQPTGTTNEGIRAPQLTKTRIAAIAAPKEGTLVYAKAESASVFSTYTGGNAAVSEMNEKGYYFFNGTKWVKINDEWEYDGARLRVRSYSSMTAPRTDQHNVFITDDGRVGIDTRNPDHALEVNGNISVGSVTRGSALKTYPYRGNLLAFEGGNNYPGTTSPTFGNSDVLGFYRWDRSADKSALRLIIGDNINAPDNDYLSIGSLSGCWHLSHWNTIDHNTNWVEYFRFTGDGQAYKAGGGTWSALSDARTKEDITNYTAGLSELMRVRPVSYRYREGFGVKGKFVGVLAQELEQIDSTMVTNSQDSRGGVDNIKYVDASNFTYMLINAVKELKAENDQLRQRLEALERGRKKR